MSRPVLLVIGIVVGLAVGAGGAIATTGAGAPEAIGGGNAPDARLAVLINGEPFVPGAPADFVVQRSVGVQSVANPEEGLFCIKAQVSAIPNNQLGRIIPTVAEAYTGSAEYQSYATYVFPRHPNCPPGTISIRTYSANDLGNLNTANNDVQFTVVVD